MIALPLCLDDDTVHVWRASLDRAPGVVQRLEAVLSDDERERARAFRFDRDRDRYVVARGTLRTLLGGYLDDAPEEVRLGYGPYGKPRLAGDGPRFNVSHSGPVALLAFSASLELGVDVELLDAQPDACSIAEHCFSAAETSRLRSLPAASRDAAFLACWTRKEAFVKARGDGLSLALDEFDVGFGPETPCALLRTAWSEAEPAMWRLVDLSDAGAGYVAALAAREGTRPIRSIQLDTIAVHEQSMRRQEIT